MAETCRRSQYRESGTQGRYPVSGHTRSWSPPLLPRVTPLISSSRLFAKHFQDNNTASVLADTASEIDPHSRARSAQALQLLLLADQVMYPRTNENSLVQLCDWVSILPARILSPWRDALSASWRLVRLPWQPSS